MIKTKILLTKKDDLKRPHPKPFDGMAISIKELRTFIQETTRIKKQPIVIFGANWCPDARLLEGVLQLPSVKNFIDMHCDVLNIDVGNYEINTELFRFFDSAIKDGIPRVFILNLKGETINLETNDRMRTARDHSAQEIFEYLQDYVGID